MKTKFNTNVNIITSILATGVICLAATLPVSATTFNVTTFTDEVSTDSQCSLREAIVNANDNAQTYPDCPAGEPGTVATDVINLPAGTYDLTIEGVDELCENPAYYTGSGTPTQCVITGTPADPYQPTITYDASKGDLDITDDLIITGAGSDVTKIQWTPTSPGVPLVGDTDPLTGDRIFQVSTTSASSANIASVVIQGLTLVNGEVGMKPTTAADVCIADNPTLPTSTTYDSSKLNAYDIEVLNSTCGTLDADGKLVGGSIRIEQFRRMGGAIALGGGYAVVDYDETKVGQPPEVISGGEGSSTYGVDSVSLNDVVIANNWSGGDGGGIYSIVPATINQSRISGNTSAGGNGGGLYNEADLTISDTLIGKVFDTVTAAAHPELTYPNIGENGGGIFFTGSPQTITTILRSAINGNEAVGGAGIAGRVAEFDITNTTISHNTARDIGAGILTAGPVYLESVTVADNVAATTSPNEGGAGLNSFAGGKYFMRHTLLANNKVEAAGKSRLANCGCAGGTTCGAGVLNSQGYNLEDGDTCQFDTTFKFDQIDTNPLLAALADNGGLTETQAIPHSAISGGVDSPAVDAGGTNCPNNDQRGSIRPADGNRDGTKDCDIGAFELFEITPDLQIANMVAPDTLVVGNNYTVTVTIANGAVDSDSNVKLVTDALPSIVTFVSATATGGSVNTCAEVSGIVTCTIGDLGGTSSATVMLTLTASAAGDATVAASVTSTGEPDASVDPNNSASVLTKVTSASSGGGGGGGGFCSYHPNGKFDPVLPGLVFMSLFYLMWSSSRSRRIDAKSKG